ncbi:MAG: hypothetical protein AVDCRST_MAG57-1484, partial [uncultured Blastococcus sp.]
DRYGADDRRSGRHRDPGAAGPGGPRRRPGRPGRRGSAGRPLGAAGRHVRCAGLTVSRRRRGLHLRRPRPRPGRRDDHRLVVLPRRAARGSRDGTLRRGLRPGRSRWRDRDPAGHRTAGARRRSRGHRAGRPGLRRDAGGPLRAAGRRAAGSPGAGRPRRRARATDPGRTERLGGGGARCTGPVLVAHRMGGRCPPHGPLLRRPARRTPGHGGHPGRRRGPVRRHHPCAAHRARHRRRRERPGDPAAQHGHRRGGRDRRGRAGGGGHPGQLEHLRGRPGRARRGDGTHRPGTPLAGLDTGHRPPTQPRRRHGAGTGQPGRRRGLRVVDRAPRAAHRRLPGRGLRSRAHRRPAPAAPQDSRLVGRSSVLAPDPGPGRHQRLVPARPRRPGPRSPHTPMSQRRAHAPM